MSTVFYKKIYTYTYVYTHIYSFTCKADFTEIRRKTKKEGFPPTALLPNGCNSKS